MVVTMMSVLRVTSLLAPIMAAFLVSGVAGTMDLIILPNKSSVDLGAVCLDGTAPAMYFHAANSTTEPAAETKWVIYFKGGGWCYEEDDCVRRSRTSDGSTSGLSQTGGVRFGPLDQDPAANPTFAHANHVELWYCDVFSISIII